MASAYDDTMSAGSERIIPNIKRFLHPSSIALVGVPRGIKPGKVFFLGLLDQGFDRPLYLVHPQAEVIDGHRTYRSVLDIPGSVDLAIIMSPKESVPGILKECCAKKIGYAILYTSGFSETGDKQGMEEEEHILALARSGGIRILGPNCMGVYSPASRLAPFPFMQEERQTGLSFPERLAHEPLCQHVRRKKAFSSLCRELRKQQRCGFPRAARRYDG